MPREETTADGDARVLPSDFVYSAYGARQTTGVSFLVKRTLAGKVDLVNVDTVANVAVKSRSFLIVAVYACNDRTDRVSFSPSVGPVPGGAVAPCLNEEMKCYPGSQVG